MSMNRFVLNIATLVLCIVSMPIFTDAQGTLIYRTLEVVAPDGSPIAGAQIETHGFGCQKTLETELNGRLRNGLPICRGDYTTTGFRVSKPGYFTFEDLGLLSGPFREGDDKPIRVELLPISGAAADQKRTSNEQAKREFLQAVKHGDSARVAASLKSGINPNITTDDLRGISGPKKVPAIALAALSGDGSTVTNMIDAGARIRGSEVSRDVLFHYLQAYRFAGAYKRSVEKDSYDKSYRAGLENLIKAGADAAALNDSGQTPLIVAVRTRNLEAVKMLLSKGVSVTTVDASGKSAIDYARERRLTPDGEDPLMREIIGHLETAKAP